MSSPFVEIHTIDKGGNMEAVGKFEKVPFDVWKDAMLGGVFSDYFMAPSLMVGMQSNLLPEMYDLIKLPERSTVGSAGYDFYAPFDIQLPVGMSLTIPTGIRVKIDDGWFLACFPRSGLGFKYKFQLDNSVGIIDSSYYYSDNYGHILVKISVERGVDGSGIYIGNGDRFVQGIFLPYGITVDDNVTKERNGGFGSTGN